jgi:ATP-dependent Clp protease ATP-binding subunit ClpC
MNITISFTENAIKHIAKVGFDPVYGARPLRRAITSNIEDKISEEILQGKIKADNSVECDLIDGSFIFKTA